jgi:hypothetical protein
LATLVDPSSIAPEGLEADDSEETSLSKRGGPRFQGKVIPETIGLLASWIHGLGHVCGTVAVIPLPLYYIFCALLL